MYALHLLGEVASLMHKTSIKCGGSTACSKCLKCIIENEVYYAYQNSNKTCPDCHHLYREHCLFA